MIGIVLLHRTRFGLHTYAIGSNPEAGRRSGLNVTRQLITIYALSGLLAGFAGWLNLAFFQSTTIGGQSTTNLSVIAGVVIGGTSLFGGYGSIFGSIVGLFIPATLQDGFVIIGIQPFWQQVVVGAVLIAAVYVDQQRRTAALRGGGVTRMSGLLQSPDHQQAGGARPGMTGPRRGRGTWSAASRPPCGRLAARRRASRPSAQPPKEQHESRCLRRPAQLHDHRGADPGPGAGRGARPGAADRDLRDRPPHPQRQVLRRVPADPRPRAGRAGGRAGRGHRGIPRSGEYVCGQPQHELRALRVLPGRAAP